MNVETNVRALSAIGSHAAMTPRHDRPYHKDSWIVMKLRRAVSETMSVVSVSLPPELVAQADAAIASQEYGGRSELVRAALRDFLSRIADHATERRRTATLTLLYPDGSERRIADIRHDHTDVVRSMGPAH